MFFFIVLAQGGLDMMGILGEGCSGWSRQGRGNGEGVKDIYGCGRR